MAQPEANAIKVTPVITCSCAPPKGPITSPIAAPKPATSDKATTGPTRSFFMASALHRVGEFHEELARHLLEPIPVGQEATLTTMTVYEYFLAWERGRRFAFRFEGCSLPLCRAGVEDYRLEELPGGRTLFTYGVYLEPTLVVRLAGPIARAQFASMFRRAAEGLKNYVAASRPR